MARIRTIKPEFFTSEDITSLTPLARLFYVSLWCESDREGRLEWKPGTFKLRYFPADECSIFDLAKELIKHGLIVLYEFEGKTFAEIPTFKEHQVINNREAESNIPARVKVAFTRVKAEGRKEGKGKEGKEGNGSLTTGGFDEFWSAWPKSERKQDKAKCAEKWAARNLDELKDKILNDIATKKKTRKWIDGYVEAPEVYLNNDRWEDGVTPDDKKSKAQNPPMSFSQTDRETGMARWEEMTGRVHPDRQTGGIVIDVGGNQLEIGP